MGSPHQTITLQCTRLLSPLLSWLSPSPTRFRWRTPQPRLTPQPLPTSLLPTRRRSFPLSLSPMSMELLMTTARPTSNHHTTTPPHHHTTTPPHHHTTTPPQHFTKTPPHHHTTAPPHHHTTPHTTHHTEHNTQ